LVSDGYPGSFSDDEIVRASGFLDLLEPGMAVMSDRGYDSLPALRQRGVDLIIPSLSHTMGKGVSAPPSRRRSACAPTGSPRPHPRGAGASAVTHCVRRAHPSC